MKKVDFKKVGSSIVLYKVEIGTMIVALLLIGGITNGIQGIMEEKQDQNAKTSRLEYDKKLSELELERAGLVGILNVEKEYDENAKDFETIPKVEYNDSPSSSVNSSSSNVSSNSENGQLVVSKPMVIDYSSLTGRSIKVLEGQSFNPMKDLQLSAKDKNGKDISSKIEILENNVNTEQPGHYIVRARVRLNDGATLTKQFSVEVAYQPLKVTVGEVTLDHTIVNKGALNQLTLKIHSSKDYVTPISLQIDGKSYPLTKSSQDNYLTTFQGSGKSGNVKYHVESIKMSDNSIVQVNQYVNQLVKKDMPTVDHLSYEFNPISERLVTNIKLSDHDHAINKVNYATVYLLDDANQQVGKLFAYANQENTLYFKVPKNGQYTMKVMAEVDLTGQDVESIELFSKTITVSSMDQTTITGQHATIYEGDVFDPIKDLQLSAIDKDGKDITESITIDGDVDTTVPGKYRVIASVLNASGEKVQKEFTVTVKARKTEVNKIQILNLEKEYPTGAIIDIDFDLELSKQYLTVESIIVNNQSYSVEHLKDSHLYKIKDISLPHETGVFDLNLETIELSNGEKVSINHSVEVTLVKNNSRIVYEEHVAEDDGFNFMEPDLATYTLGRNAQVGSSQIISDKDTNTAQASVNLSGLVRKADGTSPEGRLEVTLPTAISFVVDQEGNLQLPTALPITNNSSVGIDLSISGFTESQPDGGITVKKSVTDSDSRSSIALSISGNTNETVSLLHNETSATSLLTLSANSAGSLTLSGEAGKGSSSDVDLNGVNETFTIVFKIKKQ